MKIGIVGLGKMGLHMAARLMERGHTVVGTDRRPAKLKKLEEAGGETVKTCKDLAYVWSDVLVICDECRPRKEVFCDQD